MHQLFWKIFLSFWFSLILFAATSMLAASLYLEYTHARQDAESPRERYFRHLEDARILVKHEGLEGLSAWASELDRSEAIPLLLLDKTGNDLLGRTLSPDLAGRVQRWLQFSSDLEQRKKWWRRGAIIVPGGGEFRLIRDFQGVTLGRVLRRPRVMAIPVLVAAAISGLLCFLLARHLTTPLRHLSRATRQFADGQLDKRAMPSMGKRSDEIACLARDFDRMAERLQDLISSQKQLISDVSHELRSPLARLQVALGLARQRGVPYDNPELDRIEREAETLNELIDQLLSLASLESGLAHSPTATVDLEVLLTEVVENAEYEARMRNRHVRIVDSIPARVDANEALLRSALENVVRNAVFYTKEGSTVDISLLAGRELAGWVQVQVIDHGPGVPADMLPKLFQPFVRVSDARDRDSGGNGLGLAIAERAIRLHKGTISARNESAGGLNVIIRLPLA